jgi:hypothetical protein
MPSPSLRRKIVCLLLLSTLVATPWATAGPRPESPRRAGAPAFSLVLDLVSRAWSRLTDIQTKEGCYIDPNGRCLNGASPAPPPAAETGCYIDPNGCAAAQTDTGCNIDPDGRCRS